jgi:DNA-binding HxlR family transcriptional regulator
MTPEDLPGRAAFDAETCSIKRTLDVLGERWTLLVLREAFYGVRRFEDFQRHIGCARNVLASRLAGLVEEGVMRREPYREPKRRARHEYRLTEKGRDLLPILIALMQWGDRWRAGEGGPAVEVRHRGCGAPVEVIVRCADGHGPLTARDTRPMPGPGAVRRAA